MLVGDNLSFLTGKIEIKTGKRPPLERCRDARRHSCRSSFIGTVITPWRQGAEGKAQRIRHLETGHNFTLRAEEDLYSFFSVAFSVTERI